MRRVSTRLKVLLGIGAFSFAAVYVIATSGSFSRRAPRRGWQRTAPRDPPPPEAPRPDDANARLVFIGGNTREAERAEAALTSAGIAYRLEAEEFLQGFLWVANRTGLGFYVVGNRAADARRALADAGLRSGVIESDEPGG
jgi:hypothetical protein